MRPSLGLMQPAAATAALEKAAQAGAGGASG